MRWVPPLTVGQKHRGPNWIRNFLGGDTVTPLPSIGEILNMPAPKTQKIRALLNLGLPRSVIAKLTGSRYQVVYQVDVNREESKGTRA